MHIEDPESDPYLVNHEELLERPQIPHFSLYSETRNGQQNHRIVTSNGDELNLGHVHPAALEYLFLTIKRINQLVDDPEMISYDRLKDEYGE